MGICAVLTSDVIAIGEPNNLDSTRFNSALLLWELPGLSIWSLCPYPDRVAKDFLNDVDNQLSFHIIIKMINVVSAK